MPWSCWHRLSVASPVEAMGEMVGTRVVPMVLRDPALIRFLKDAPTHILVDG